MGAQGRWRKGLVGLLSGAVAVALCALPATASADRFLYVSNGLATGNFIAGYEIGNNGSLTAVPGNPFPSGGTTTEGIAMSPDAENVYVALFGTSRVGAFTVNANGSLTGVPGTPFATGFGTPLSVQVDPDGGHLFATNHGANFSIGVSTINANGSLTNISGSPFPMPAPRRDPFAASITPDGEHYYTPSENNNPPSAPEVVVAWDVAANGALSFIESQASGNTLNQANPFGSALTPDGQFLFVSNPEDGATGTISSFQINADGSLTPIVQFLSTSPGNHPLNMAVSPDGAHLYVATRASNTVNAYDINTNGTLSPIPGQPFATNGTNGKGIAITPDGEHVYVSNQVSDNISRFAVQSNGALTFLGTTTLPANADADLESIVISPNQGPTASFTSTPGIAGAPTTFDATPSVDEDGAVETYDWDFGDGTTLTDGGPNPSHVYAAGTYTVELTVTDNENCSTERIFTGKAMLCNGSASATTTRQVEIVPGTFARKVTIRYKQRKERFKGKVKSDSQDCIDNEKVKVFRKKRGPDRAVGSTKSKSNGKWKLKERDAEGKFYARLKQKTQADGETCLAAKSKKKRVS